MKQKAVGFLFLLIISCLFITISDGYGGGGGGGRSGGGSSRGGGSSSSRGSSGSSSGSESPGSGGRSSGGSGKGGGGKGGGGRSYSPGYYGHTPYYGSSPTTRRNCRTNNTRCNAAGSMMITKHMGTRAAFPVFVTLTTAIALVM